MEAIPMVTDTRVIEENLFMKLEHQSDGTYVGKIIELHPAVAEAGGLRAAGSYTEYSTSVCRSPGDAEIATHAILDRIRGEKQEDGTDENNPDIRFR
jgi:hypothetical protein